VPSPREPAVGGIVKLQHLSRMYPAAGSRFNVLYLVTSRLPDGAVALADWARRKGAIVVVNQNGVAYPGWYGDGWERVNAPMAALLARAAHVFYQSRFCQESADRFVGAPAGSFEVLYNAVDTSEFVPGPKPAGRRALTLLLAGSQDQRYRVESAVRTLAALVRRGHDAELLITGRLGWSDPVTARQHLDALVAQLGMADRIELLGRYAQVDAPALFRQSDIVLHTKYNDPCPTAVIEALACGRPVVYSSSGGVPELVAEAGVGVHTGQSWTRDIPPDPEQLADAVCEVRERLADLGAAARARAVERFDVARWRARHRDVFERLVA
jgi:glycosyltransferase involved in cell wall biosynthesis